MAADIVMPDLSSIGPFLQERLPETGQVHFAPRIPPAKEAAARASCRIPEGEKLLALVDATLSGSGKNGVVFTDSSVYAKAFGKDAVILSYAGLPACPYERIREIIAEATPSENLPVLVQRLKNQVMYGDPGARPIPRPADEDPHPVRSWLVNAGTFLVFVVLVPGCLWTLGNPKDYRLTRSLLGLVSVLSWLSWFHSHRVTVRRADRFSPAAIRRRIVMGVSGAALFMGAVVTDRVAAAPTPPDAVHLAWFVGGSLAGAALCLGLLFVLQKRMRQKRSTRAIRRVAGRYLERAVLPGAEGLHGLLDAGICDLDGDRDIRQACRLIAERTAHPFGEYRHLLEGTDLMAFFEHARDRGYDFARHGKPDEVARCVPRRTPNRRAPLVT
ncbi:MAG: hypothetical protein JXO51_11330 [Candidatus Aminicenantes bacterium]|nr:hypothetical protein [Candidatus Aminicenantes bacterium]